MAAACRELTFCINLLCDDTIAHLAAGDKGWLVYRALSGLAEKQDSFLASLLQHRPDHRLILTEEQLLATPGREALLVETDVWHLIPISLALSLLALSLALNVVVLSWIRLAVGGGKA